MRAFYILILIVYVSILRGLSFNLPSDFYLMQNRYADEIFGIPNVRIRRLDILNFSNQNIKLAANMHDKVCRQTECARSDGEKKESRNHLHAVDDFVSW